MENDIITATAARLTEVSEKEEKMRLRSETALPASDELDRMMRLVQNVIFPGFYHECSITDALEDICTILTRQAARGYATTGKGKQAAATAASALIESLPDIKRSLLTDIEAIAHNDPAVRNFAEVVCSYPVVKVMTFYRVAHRLYELGVPVIPRMLTETAHSATGIDIHPAAQIGDYFCIDHGTGVVIGATTIIGNHVMLYQGVTLGARNFRYGDDGNPIDEPRHPILEDNVTVYSNTSILGRVRIGHDTVIGGNIWLTHDVPPHSRMLQGKAQDSVRI